MSEVLLYVEIDISYCSLTYGVPPCQATLTGSPPTGTIKCFNTRGTCQDIANYTDLDEPGDCPQVPTTLRFSLDTAYLPPEIDSLPFIEKPEDVEITPQTVSLGQNLGTRGTVRVKMRDGPHSDAGVGFDKYLSERTYNPVETGSFWGKFRARHPSLRGRALRVIRGLVGQELEEMENRHFTIETTDGPTPDGYFTIVAKDILKLADSDRAMAPEPSNGFLSAGISAVDGSLTLSDTGIGSTYPLSGHANIGGQEIVSFTRSGDVLTIVRGQLNTEAVEHDAGDRVQVLYRQVSQDGIDIIWDLLVNYAGISAALIDLDEWRAESDAFLNNVYTLNVAEPTGVNTLVSRLIQQMGAALWQDELSQQIRFQILRAVSTEADVYDSSVVKEQSMSVTEQPDKRISRMQVYFGQINPLKRHDELENYRSMIEVSDTDAEAAYGGPAIARLLADGIAAGGRTIAERVGYAHLSRYVTPPRRINFRLSRDAGHDPELGRGYQVGSWMIQADTGEETTTGAIITRVKAKAEEFEIEAEEMLWTEYAQAIVDPTQHVIILDADENNINIRTRHDELYEAAISGDTVTVYVNSGVTIGSADTSIAAIDWGTWAAGVARVMVNNGRIQGRGGYAGSVAGPTFQGGDGGLALKTTVSVTMTNNGEIFGGGGGGGLGIGPGGSRQGGGGGGAGTVPGEGGAGTAAGGPGTADAGGTPGFDILCNGGFGGGPGLAGSSGAAGAGGAAHAGGSAGNAIDGISQITMTDNGDIRGAQVN